ncbi:hypothetical protein V8C86DRAFT_2637546, partial [Haematococcus lacustris]
MRAEPNNEGMQAMLSTPSRSEAPLTPNQKADQSTSDAPRACSAQECVNFVATLLSHVVASGALTAATKAAVEAVGWQHCVLLPSSLTSEPTLKEGAKASDGGQAAKKERAPRSIGLFQVYQALALDRMATQPSNPAYKVPQAPDANGVLKDIRGARLTMASALWAGLGEERRALLTSWFKPLCEALNEEALRTKTKHEHILGRIQAYQKSLSSEVQAQIEEMLDVGTVHLLNNRARMFGVQEEDRAAKEPQAVAQPVPSTQQPQSPDPATKAAKGAETSSAKPAVPSTEPAKQSTPAKEPPVAEAAATPETLINKDKEGKKRKKDGEESAKKKKDKGQEKAKDKKEKKKSKKEVVVPSSQQADDD